MTPEEALIVLEESVGVEERGMGRYTLIIPDQEQFEKALRGVREAIEATDEAKLRDALAFYANPDSYFAIFILPDRPAGEFADDFSDADHLAEYAPYGRLMPGKLARETLGMEAPHEQKESDNAAADPE